LQKEVSISPQNTLGKCVHIFNKVFDKTLDSLAYFAAFILGFMALAVTLQIVTRYFFNTPWLWPIEVTQYCQVWITFLCAAWILRKDGHVIVDFLPNMLKPRSKVLLYTVLSFLGIMVCLVYSIYGVQVTVELLQKETHLSTILMPPSYLVYLIMPIGSILLTFQFIRRTIGLVNKYKSLKSPQQV
jgi:C4-dicarboxylate transporter DctQ subunit